MASMVTPGKTRRILLIGFVGSSLLISSCAGGGSASQAGPNDRAACQSLDLLYANNGANPIDPTQAANWSTLGLRAENGQLRMASQRLVTAIREGNAVLARTELGIAAATCSTMGAGPGPGFVPNTGTGT
jgi:hypothetical protein